MEMLQQAIPVVGLVNWSEHVRHERGRVVSSFTGTLEGDANESRTVVAIGRTPEGEAGPGTTIRIGDGSIFELKGGPLRPKTISDHLGDWHDNEPNNRWIQARAKLRTQIAELSNVM